MAVIGQGHVDPDDTLQDMLEQARLQVAVSEDMAVLQLADGVLQLHDHLMVGGALPSVWKAAAA